jgi:PAS domain S-box-containing protein
MSSLQPSVGPQRVLLLLPTAKDAEITVRLFNEHGFESHICCSLTDLCQEADAGAGAVVIAEERLLDDADGLVEQMLREQPAWSDLPVIILTSPSEINLRALDGWHQAANVTLVRRPLQIALFLSVIRSRLSDRARQYTVRDLLHTLDTRGREFRQLADSMPQMVFAADRRGRLEYLNHRASAYLGVGLAEARQLPWTDAIHPEDAEHAQAKWRRSIEEGVTFQSELRVRDVRTNKYRWHLARALPIWDENGVISRWFGTGTDIHQQKLNEQKLNIALERAAAAGAAKSEFVANMSHEIRTPMTSILGYAELLEQKEQDPEKLHFLSIIRQNGAFLLEIINDILDLSKIEAGKLEIVPERFELAPFVHEIHSLMQVRAAESGVRFGVEFEGPVPATLRSDPKRLRQVLVNLVGNALKFTKKGAVRLVVRRDKSQVAFDVIDTGIGMTEEQVGQLFQPFHQADASVTRRFGGTGLGLAISHRLAAMLGGEISVVSEAGVGSTFTLKLEAGKAPMRSAIRTPAEDDDDAASLRLKKACRLLVVDDRREIRFLAGRILSGAGAQVEYAENGYEAVQIVERQMATHTEPDLVLLDMQMPTMDGYQAAAELRSLGYESPIIALTADAMQGDMDRCLRSGCNAYLSKPIETEKMLRMINEHLSPSGAAH